MKNIYILILIFSTFIAKADYWTQKADFPLPGRGFTFSFSIGDKGYIGCGQDDSLFLYHNDFWEYDPTTNVWTQKANFGGSERIYSIGFSIGNKGYAGLGRNQQDIFFQDFWEYDPLTNGWIQKANFAGGMRYLPAGFSIGTMGYIGTGADSGNLNQPNCYDDLWQYNPAADTWSQKTSLPGDARYCANSFVLGSNGYIVGGSTNGSAMKKDLWQYNSITDSWSQKANFPFNRCLGASFSICDMGYFGAGSIPPNPFYIDDWWQYNPATNSWVQKTDVPGLIRGATPACFVIGSKGYVGLGGRNGFGEYYKDLWEYTPDSTCATGIDDLPTSQIEFTISPNPVKDLLVISYSLSGKRKINLTISDVNGKNVYSQHYENSNASVAVQSDKAQIAISLNGFSKGIYFVEASDGKQKAVRKFVKE